MERHPLPHLPPPTWLVSVQVLPAPHMKLLVTFLLQYLTLSSVALVSGVQHPAQLMDSVAQTIRASPSSETWVLGTLVPSHWL